MDTLTFVGSRWVMILLEEGALLGVGVLASGLIDAFVGRAAMARLPRRTLPAAITGALLGLVIPAGSVGSIVVARRLLIKGAAPALVVAYLLGGPLLSLIALAGLAAAPVTLALAAAVMAATLTLALTGGWVWSLHPAPGALLRRETFAHAGTLTLAPGLHHAWTVAARETVEIGRWLVIGGLLAAILGAAITPEALDSRVESPEATAWAGLLLGFAHATGPLTTALAAPDVIARLGSGAAAGFLLMGAAASLTRVIALLAVFRWRMVLALVALIALVAALAGAWIALNTSW